MTRLLGPAFGAAVALLLRVRLRDDYQLCLDNLRPGVTDPRATNEVLEEAAESRARTGAPPQAP